MKSVAKAFVEMFGLDGASIRSAKLDHIISTLIYTIASDGKLSKAIHDITSYTELEIEDSSAMEYIKKITTSPELVALCTKPKATKLIIELLPWILATETISTVTLEEATVKAIINRSNTSHMYSELRKVLDTINSYSFGYKVLLKNVSNGIIEFHVIKFSTVDELKAVLKDNGLLTPKILDKVL